MKQAGVTDMTGTRVRNSLSVAVVLVLFSMVWGCRDTTSEQGKNETAPAASPLILHVAASMTDVMGQLGNDYTASSGQEVRFSFASSGTLARQIDSGAEGDIYVSANTKWMDYLSEKGHIDITTRFNLVRNELVLIAPVSRPFKIVLEPGAKVQDAFEGFLSVGDFSSVPAGTYAEEALKYLGCFDAFSGRFALGNDVRCVLMRVVHAEAGAGIVYRTDALQSSAVMIAGVFPSASHSPIVYPAALLRCSSQPARARDLIAFLKGDRARAVFEKFGFRMAQGDESAQDGNGVKERHAP